MLTKILWLAEKDSIKRTEITSQIGQKEGFQKKNKIKNKIMPRLFRNQNNCRKYKIPSLTGNSEPVAAVEWERNEFGEKWQQLSWCWSAAAD